MQSELGMMWKQNNVNGIWGNCVTGKSVPPSRASLPNANAPVISSFFSSSLAKDKELIVLK